MSSIPQISALPSPVPYNSHSPRNGSRQNSTSPIMGEDEANTNGGPLDIQRALDIARNTEGDLDPAISSFLESMLSQLWGRIESEPDRYILTKDEFAVFNFFITRFNGSEKAEKAIARFWRNHQE